MATRKRDFFRLNKKDRADLKLLLGHDVTIPVGIARVSGPQVTERLTQAFFRLHKKYLDRLYANG